jgi:hypothetical protein
MKSTATHRQETVAAKLHIGQHGVCNDHNVTRAIFDAVRSKRAESNRSRDLTQYLIYAAPTQSHTCQKVADFELAANWTNEGRSSGGDQSLELMRD